MKDKVLKFEAFVDQKGILRLPRRLLDDAAILFTGKEVIGTLQDRAEVRTADQNAYYWVAIVNPICDRFNDLGERFTPDIVHEILKYKFLRVFKYDGDTGEVLVEYVRSSSSLKVHEFCFYIEDCIRYAAEDLELTIEPPKKKRAEFNFSQFEKPKETRRAYLKRIGRYVEDIFEVPDLKRFFNQNDDWKEDIDVKAIFRTRADQIKAAKNT